MKKIIEEFEDVALVTDLPKYGLRAGDIGVVVDIHDKGAGFTVEFMRRDGTTVAVVTLNAHQIREIGETEMLQSRPLEIF
jgi:SOS-response transcriptional repressor LexA